MGYVRNIFWLILISVMIVEGQETAPISRYLEKQPSRSNIEHQITYPDIRPGDRVDRQTDYNLQRDTADTLVHASYGWNSQFIQEPGDAMLVVYQMPGDLIIKGVNVPVASWGTGDQQLALSLHRVSYPYRSDSLIYSSTIVDGNGWIGGYDMDSTGRMEIVGTTYSSGGTVGICDPSDAVAIGAQDPLGSNWGWIIPHPLPIYPGMGLVWPDGIIAATLEPLNHPALDTGGGDNWLNTNDYGTEPEFLSGEYIGILVQSTGAGGGDAPETGFLYQAAEPLGLTNPWPALKFYGSSECGGTSGNDGWHIRHWVFDFELAVLFTGDRAPIISNPTILTTTYSTEPRDISVIVTDDNPSGGPAGVDSVEFYLSIDDGDFIGFQLVTSGNNLYTGQIPGQLGGTSVEYYYRATDVEGNEARTVIYGYNIFSPFHSSLFIYNSSQFAAWIQNYYLANTGLEADFWSYGVVPPDVLDHYYRVIEVTAGGPLWINNNSIRPWVEVEEHSRHYILAGDEWLGYQTNWTDSIYAPGSFQYDILGIAADHNDISGGTGTSRLLTVADDPISGDLHTFLGDSLDLNYDPSYEIGQPNLLDGVTPAPGVNVAFYGLSGTIDSLNNPPADADTFAVGIYHILPGQGKVAFFTFDPLSLNTTPVYHWIGLSNYNLFANTIDYWFWLEWGTVAEENNVPTSITLYRNYPNPFNPVTTIRYELPERTDIRLTIYDLRGREVAVLANGVQRPGISEVRWDATNVASGIYFYRLQSGDQTITRKMVVLK